MSISELEQAGGAGRRLWWDGAVAAAGALVVNALIRTAAVTLFGVSPELRPFTWPQLTLFTLVGVLGATVVFGLVARRSPHPAETFRRIAIAVLALSFLPDVTLLVTDILPGMTVAAFWSLVAMHVATAAITIARLTRCQHGTHLLRVVGLR